jgi:NitT/TauT family transport system substrate-binding protein
VVHARFRRTLTVVALAGALLAAGCSSNGGSGAAAGPPEKPSIVVASVPTGDAAGLFIAEQRGFFAAHGLSVKIVPVISGADAISAQLSGKYDITFGNYVSYIQAAAKGAPLHVLAAGSVMGPAVQMIMAGPNSPITGVQQLVGRKVAVNVTGNIGTLLIDSVLTSAAVPATAKVTLVPMPFPAMAQALKAGKVDAAWMPEPFVTQAESAVGAEPLADANAGLTQNLPIGGYIVTNSWMQKNPRTAAAFVAALREGQQVATTDGTAIAKALIAYAHVPAGTAAIEQSPVYPLTVDPAAIQRIADLMLRFGLIPHGFSTRAMTR